MKRYNRFITLTILFVISCMTLTACGRATTQKTINCINYSHDLAFSAKVTAKYGTADPMCRSFETKASINEIAERIREDNTDLTVSVENDDIIFVGVKSDTDNGFTKPRVAIIKTGNRTYLQTAMGHKIKQASGTAEVYLDYGIFEENYAEMLNAVNDDFSGKKLKLKKAYDRAEILRQYGLWGFNCVADSENPSVVAVSNTHFTSEQAFTFTFSTEDGENYLTIT